MKYHESDTSIFHNCKTPVFVSKMLILSSTRRREDLG